MSKSEINEIAQLATTFSMACKKVVEEGKAGIYMAPTVMVAETVLIAPAGVHPKRNEFSNMFWSG